MIGPDAITEYHLAVSVFALRRQSSALVDSICSSCRGAQHLCAALEPCLNPAVLAMASTKGRHLVGRQSTRRGNIDRNFLDWLGRRAVEHVPNQPFRPIRNATGLRSLSRKSCRAAQLPNAYALQIRPSSDLFWISPRFLGNSGDDGRSLVIRNRHNWLHLHRNSP